MTPKQQPATSDSFCSDKDSSLKVLAIDTSTSTASAAIVINQKIVAESIFCTDRTLSARLIPEIERLMTLAGFAIADVDLFAASIGPGSFTGVRGGVATIQGLALACGKQCLGYSSLALLAMNFSLSPYPVCPLLDARKSEVYGGLYDCSNPIPLSIVPDCVMPPEDLLELIRTTTDQPVIFVGDGAVRYREIILECVGKRAVIAPAQLHGSRASNGATLALDAYRRGEALAPQLLLPVYLRASDAEINRKPKS